MAVLTSSRDPATGVHDYRGRDVLTVQVECPGCGYLALIDLRGGGASGSSSERTVTLGTLWLPGGAAGPGGRERLAGLNRWPVSRYALTLIGAGLLVAVVVPMSMK